MLSKRALELFNTICTIPHPSAKTKELREWICAFLSCIEGVEVEVDGAGNIHAKKGDPKLCLQAHYDMVLVPSGAQVRVVFDVANQMLRAQNSSLGADNGAGLSVILALFEQEKDVECLLSNDEEIGLLGAKNLDLSIQSAWVLNLDSEFFGAITCSCAGGYVLESKGKKALPKRDFSYVYEVRAQNFPSGHSGLDIHRSENAIVQFFKEFSKHGLVELQSGLHCNVIPKDLHAVIASRQRLQPNHFFVVTQIDRVLDYALDMSVLGDLIQSLGIGVRGRDEDLRVIDSLNLASIRFGIDATEGRENNASLKSPAKEVLAGIEAKNLMQDAWMHPDLAEARVELLFMGRANTRSLLEQNQRCVERLCDSFGLNSQILEYYPPWEKGCSDEDVAFLQALKKAFAHRSSSVEPIHAGLECGILGDVFNKRSHKAALLSIGPSIFHPHGVRESLDVASFEEFCLVVSALFAHLKAGQNV